MKRSLIPALLLGLMPPAPAATRDEIRVYTDELAEPGEFEFEGHFNTIARGRGRGDALEGPRPLSGLIVTPELSYGLTEHLEIEGGFFVPQLRAPDGQHFATTPHARLKWVGQRAPDTGGWFWGAVLEWSPSSGKPAAVPAWLDLRPVLGWRSPQWLFAANLVLERPLGGTGVSRTPSLGPALKLVRRVDAEHALGVEYHGEWGPWNRFAPPQQRPQTVYLTLDLPRRAIPLHLGVGHGLNAESGRWSLKGSVQFDLD